MLERKKLFAGIFAALLALNLYGTKVEAATDAETEEARMWGGFRDKISCTVEGSVANTTTTTKETVIIKEVPVYRYPFLFIWDDGIIGEDGITTITTYGIDHQDRSVLTLVDHPYIDPLVPTLGNLSLDRALADLLPNKNPSKFL